MIDGTRVMMKGVLSRVPFGMTGTVACSGAGRGTTAVWWDEPIRAPNDRDRHVYTVVTSDLEVLGMEAKKLNADTVKAVGGCQQDALVALLKEMGYEIEEPKPEGVYVVPGMYAEHVEYGRVVIAEPNTRNDDWPQYVYYVRQAFDKKGVEIDGGTLSRKHKLTVNGRPVLGYR